MPSAYLLDTHVILDLGVTRDLTNFPAKLRPLIRDPKVELLLSAASEVELAIKSSLGKLALTKGELSLIYESAIITPYPLRREHADRLFDLPFHHKDPFDRMIIATAIADGLPVITRDKQFRQYKGLHVVW
jgi:PIN domain nuclease of toxin-antitoxin system